jgi:site-specific DNA recombinase
VTAPAPARAGIYARISRDRVGAGLGVARQTGDCRELADRLGLTVVTQYSDNDLSAYSGKPRPGYKRLLADIGAGRVDVVLCWHTDRLHRSPIELEEWITACEPRGVAVHTVQAGELDLATPSGRLVARQLGAVARYESEHRSERVKAKQSEIRRDGKFGGGGRPFGYTADGMDLVEVEADAVRDGVAMILRGGSLRGVTADWRARGLRTTQAGREWTPGAVRDVLTRWRNAAVLEHHGQPVGPARWAPIVSEDELRGVRAVLLSPARRTSPGNQPKWLGSGLYRCGVCGLGMVVGTSGQHRHPSYCCRSKRDGGARHVTRAAHSLDAAVSGLVVARLSGPDAADLLRPAAPYIDTDAVRSELAVVEAERVGLAERLGAGQISLAMLDVADAGLRARQEAAEAALATAAVQSPAAELAAEADVARGWAARALDTRRAVLAELLVVTVLPSRPGRKRGGEYFDPDTIKIEWRADEA